MLRLTCLLQALWVVAGQVSGGGGSWGGSWGSSSSSSSSSFWDGYFFAMIFGRPATKGEATAMDALLLVVLLLVLGGCWLWITSSHAQYIRNITDPTLDRPYPGAELPDALKKLQTGEWIWMGSFRHGHRMRKFQITTFEFNRQTCRLLGRGQDKYGPFSIDGRVIKATSELNFIKQYDDREKGALAYFGTLETKGEEARVSGSWSFVESGSISDGSFFMKTAPFQLKDSEIKDQQTKHDILDSLV